MYTNSLYDVRRLFRKRVAFFYLALYVQINFFRKDNGGCLLALDARGRKFESCFPD